jgi:hypothetical protein
VRHVSGGYEEVGLERCAELAYREEGREILSPTDMRVGEMQNPRGHRRGRLYVATVRKTEIRSRGFRSRDNP